MGASLKLIKERITKSKHLQEQIRAHEFRDRSIAERNFERINFWSLIQVIVMIVAGLSQVLMIRSIFDEKSPVRKILFSKWYVCTNLITSVVGTKFSVWMPKICHLQLNEYETAPNFIQLTQNLTSDCLLI